MANAASGGTGAGVPAKLGKKAMRKALAAARALTPVEALMARVGLLGKPAVITVGAAAAGSGGGGEDEEGAEAGGGDGDGDGDGDGGTRAAVRSALPATSVALPPGLRLARLTCGPGSKDARLYHFLLRFPGRSLVFVNSIGALKRVAALLGALRLPLHTLHASMQQRQRLKHLDAFRADPHRGVLVCTDVAARGLDIPAVGLVLHYSLPPSAEVFVHRCGRTARALSAGLAVALVSAEDQRAYSRILSVLGLAGVGLPEFPLDDGPYERRLGSRVALARRLCESQSAANKLSSSQHRLLTMAAEAGLELDDATAAEEGLGGGGGEWPPAGRAGAKKKQRRQQASEEDEEGGGGDGEGGGGGGGGRRAGEAEEDRADAAWRAKMQARATSSLRRELDALLAQPLAPAGMSRRYVAAVNPLLVTGAVAPGGGGGGGGGGRAGKAAALTASRASHPLHGRVSVAQQPEEAHGNGADEGEEEEGGRSSTRPAARPPWRPAPPSRRRAPPWWHAAAARWWRPACTWRSWTLTPRAAEVVAAAAAAATPPRVAAASAASSRCTGCSTPPPPRGAAPAAARPWPCWRRRAARPRWACRCWPRRCSPSSRRARRRTSARRRRLGGRAPGGTLQAGGTAAAREAAPVVAAAAAAARARGASESRPKLATLALAIAIELYY